MYEDESSGTPMSSRRPIGTKIKDKAKATSSQNPAPAPVPIAAPTPTSAAGHAYAELVAAANQRTLLDTHHALKQCEDPGEAEYLKWMIDDLWRRLGMM